MKLIQNEKGFSLIEVVVTSAILALILVPLITTLAQSQKVVYYGRAYLEADNLIMQAAEEAKAAAFASLQSQTQNNYKGTPYTLYQNVKVLDLNNLKQVELILKDGSKTKAQISLLVYAKGV